VAVADELPLDSLTEAQKERVRYHLGYMETSFAASIQLGIPRPVQTVFLLEQALELLVNAHAVARVRCILDILDNVEASLVGAQQSLSVERMGEMTLHPLRGRGLLATDSLEREYQRWGKRLADIMGVPIYPYSTRYRKTGPGTVVPVS
jgi:hypothetical protein